MRINSLQTKIIMISIVIILVAMSLHTIVMVHVFEKEFTDVLQSKTSTVADQLKMQLDRLLKLNIPFEDILGFEEQCKEAVSHYADIDHAMVVDGNGLILFHNDVQQIGKSLSNSLMFNAAEKNQKQVILIQNNSREMYESIIPFTDVHGVFIGSIIVGFSKQQIVNKVKDAILKPAIFILIASFFLAVVFMALFISFWITVPLKKLLTVIEQIRLEKRLDKRATVTSRDEIGQLASLFNSMVTDLQTSMVSIDVLKQEQQRFYDVVETSGDWIWETDVQGRYSYVHTVVEKIIGYRPDEVLGKSITHFCVIDKEKEQNLPLKSLLEECKSLYKIQSTNKRKDGKVIMIETTAVPIVNEAGQHLGYRGVHRDITERIQSEEKRITLEKELAQSQKLESIGTLAAGLAHEINTPIQFISDNTEFISESVVELLELVKIFEHFMKDKGESESTLNTLKELEAKIDLEDIEYLQEEIPKAVAETLDGISRVSTIVRAMKEFSHMGSDEKLLDDINKAIENTVIISRNEWRYAAEMKLELDPDLPLVKCYIGDMKQVILNLIVNAAHAIKDELVKNQMDKGEILIRTRLEDNNVIIAIKDTGGGIPENIRSKVFDHFFTTKELGKGTGQGLSIAYQAIVEKNHGNIWFETEIGKGTTFYVSIPAV